MKPQRALLGEKARLYMLVPMMLAGPAAYASFHDKASSKPVMRALLNVAPGWVWGLAWIGVLVCALITLRYGVALTYQITNVSMIFLSMMSGGATAVAKVVDDQPLTSMWVGLWLFVAGGSMFAAFMPYAVARPPGPDDE